MKLIRNNNITISVMKPDEVLGHTDASSDWEGEVNPSTGRKRKRKRPASKRPASEASSSRGASTSGRSSKRLRKQSKRKFTVGTIILVRH